MGYMYAWNISMLMRYTRSLLMSGVKAPSGPIQ